MIIKQAYIGILDTASDGEGNSWICFFPPEPLGAYLKTSYGDIQKTADNLSIATRNSQYSFHIDNDCLTDVLKEIWKKNMKRVFPEILDQIEKIL